MAVAGMVINVGLNLIFIPHWQALGSAWASLGTQLITALAQTILAVVILKLTVNYKLIGKLAIFIGFVTLAGFVSRHFDTWYVGYLAMIVASVLFALFTRLINLTALAQIIRNDQNENEINS
jgi:O-antigen/teichoic acid export membrane protein